MTYEKAIASWAKAIVYGLGVLVVLIFVLAVTGCVTTGSVVVPDNRTVTNTVAIPVSTPCFERQSLPRLPSPTPVDAERATTDQLAAAAAADAEAFQLYSRTVAQMWEVCLKQQPTQPATSAPAGAPAK